MIKWNNNTKNEKCVYLFRLIAKTSPLKILDRKEGEWGGLSYTESWASNYFKL